MQLNGLNALHTQFHSKSPNYLGYPNHLALNKYLNKKN